MNKEFELELKEFICAAKVIESKYRLKAIKDIQSHVDWQNFKDLIKKIEKQLFLLEKN